MPAWIPTVVVGGKVAAMGGSNARVGKSDFLVVESDESDGSFLKLSPDSRDRHQYRSRAPGPLRSLDDIRAAFIEFVNKVPFYGAAICAWTMKTCRASCPRSGAAPITYGAQRAGRHRGRGDARAARSASDFQPALRASSDLGEFHLRVAGRAQRAERDGGHRRWRSS